MDTFEILNKYIFEENHNSEIIYNIEFKYSKMLVQIHNNQHRKIIECIIISNYHPIK